MSTVKEGFIRRYSGDYSKKFWQRVNHIQAADGTPGEAYSLGVVLQDMESRILGLLEGLEGRTRHVRAKRGKGKA